MEKLSKAWSKLKVSSSRQQAGVSWLKWPSDDIEDVGEPSAIALQNNVMIIYVMVQLLQTFDPVPIHTLQKQVC